MSSESIGWRLGCAFFASLLGFALTAILVLMAIYLANWWGGGTDQDFRELAKATLPVVAGVAVLAAVIVGYFANRRLEQHKGAIAIDVKTAEQDRGVRQKGAEQLRIAAASYLGALNHLQVGDFKETAVESAEQEMGNARAYLPVSRIDLQELWDDFAQLGMNIADRARKVASDKVASKQVWRELGGKFAGAHAALDRALDQFVA